MGKIIYTFIAGVCLTLAATLSAHAQAGSLDNTFGTGGKVTTAIGSSVDKGISIAIQSNSKIVVAGFSYNGSDNDFAVVRYNTDGSLDNTFGSGGKVTTDFGNTNDYGYSVAIQTDNKIVVAGFIYNGSDPDFALVRYNSDGSLDNTFGSGGKVTTDFWTSQDYGSAVAIQDDDKIVVAGYSNNGSSINNDFAIARYNSNGGLDNTFSTDGKDTTDFGSSIDQAYSVVIQSDHKIVVAGFSGKFPGPDDDFALVRYNSDGSLDNTFDTDGKVTTNVVGSDDKGYSVCLQTDGKIVLAGVNGITGDFALVRYNSNGSLDNTFGSGGKVTTDFGSSLDYSHSVAIQNDGKIVAVGYSNTFDLDFALARYNIDGTLDNTFDTDGKVITDFGGSNDEGLSVAIQSDGKIVMAGDSYNPDYNFAVARYNGGTVGIPENNTDGNTITLYPNPFTNEVSIKGTKENGVVVIYNITGKEIIRQKAMNEATKINTEILSPGFYLLNYSEGNKTVNSKLTKF